MTRRIGIDFGTCNIKGAERKKNNTVSIKIGSSIDKQRVPNVILYKENEGGYKYNVGDAALNRAANEQDRIRCVKSSLQEKGWNRELSFGNIRLTASDVICDIMSYLYEDIHKANKKSDISATITVPVNFSERQKMIVEKAAEKAGFTVDSVISEPFAAMFYLMEDYIDDDEKHNILIFDFGGGTLDFCLASMYYDKNDRRIVETQSTVGITYGGNDINKDILNEILAVKYHEYIDKAFRQVKNKFEEIINKYYIFEAIDMLKSDLFDDEEVDEKRKEDVMVTLHDSSLLEFKGISVADIYETFEKRGVKKKIHYLLDQLYDDSNIIIGETTDVFVVGGSASIPYFRNILEIYFEENGYNNDIDDLFAINDDMDMDDRLYSSVAKGAAIYQELKNGDSDIDIMIKEKIPFVVYTKNDSGKIQTKITKNDFYKDYFSNYAGITKKMKEDKKISVYQTIFGEEDKEVYLGDISLSDEIIGQADLYKLKVDRNREIEAVFGIISEDASEDEIWDEWKCKLVIDTE